MGHDKADNLYEVHFICISLRLCLFKRMIRLDLTNYIMVNMSNNMNRYLTFNITHKWSEDPHRNEQY